MQVLVRASPWLLLVRFGEAWFRYEHWHDLLRDLEPRDRLRVQAVTVSESQKGAR